MHTMVSLYQEHLEPNANLEQARRMSAYMRNQFPYLGIKGPQLEALLREFYARRGLPPLADLDDILLDLWALPEREYQYIGMGLLNKFEKKLPETFMETIETLLVTKPWWDTVDLIASHTVAAHFRRFPVVRAERLPRWRASDNFWLRRAAILFQLRYKQETDFGLLCEIIRENLGSKEFFINKAIGWALREYAKVDEQAVRSFAACTPLSPLSAREALKRLNVA